MRRRLLSLTVLGLLPGIAGCVSVSADDPTVGKSGSPRPRHTAEAGRRAEQPERARAPRAPGHPGHPARPAPRHSRPPAHPTPRQDRPAAVAAPAAPAAPARPVAPPPAPIPAPRGVPSAVMPHPGTGSVCDMAGRHLSPEQMALCRLYAP